MHKHLGIVELNGPTNGKSLKRHLARRFGGKSLLEWTVRRITDCQRLDGVIAICDETVDDHFLAKTVPPDVPVFRKSSVSPLERLNAALSAHPAEAIVRVGQETPFVDPAMIDSLVAAAERFPGCDYVGYCSRDGQPVFKSRVGIFAEWCKTDAIRRAVELASSDTDRINSTEFVFSHPEIYQLRFISIPTELDRGDLRLMVDGNEDWEHAEAILEALGNDDLGWRQIVRLLDHQPSLRKRMAILNHEQAAKSSPS